MARITITPFTQSILTDMLATNEMLCAAHLGRCMQHPRSAISSSSAAYKFLKELYYLNWAEFSVLNSGIACTGIAVVGYNTTGAEHFRLTEKGRLQARGLFENALQKTEVWYHHSGTACRMPLQSDEILPHVVWRVC